MIDNAALHDGLLRVCARAGLGAGPAKPERLTGGATMESWRFSCDGRDYVLRRAPSLAFMHDRPFGHDVEAAIIRKSHEAGVTAPAVIAELQAEDGIGSGFVMEALPGTPDPRQILEMDDPAALLKQAARDLARIHSLRREDLPEAVPLMDPREAIEDLRAQFEEAGSDRPIIALGLKWLEEHCPPQVAEPVLNHGDYRMGNLLAENSQLTGVLDWELAHFGDRHEDLAFGCMAVWRFHRYDRPALGLGSLEDYFAAYEAEAGIAIDRERFRYWLVHRTVWWALNCLKMAKIWRSGEDRMLERVVISRRTSEQELDLLMLLEEDAPATERARLLSAAEGGALQEPLGDATLGEIASAVSEWLATVKHRMEGHDRFQLAVARNALGIIARNHERGDAGHHARGLAREILAAKRDLHTPGLLASLRQEALDKVAADSPKYPALAAARSRWSGEN